MDPRASQLVGFASPKWLCYRNVTLHPILDTPEFLEILFNTKLISDPKTNIIRSLQILAGCYWEGTTMAKRFTRVPWPREPRSAMLTDSISLDTVDQLVVPSCIGQDTDFNCCKHSLQSKSDVRPYFF